MERKQGKEDGKRKGTKRARERGHTGSCLLKRCGTGKKRGKSVEVKESKGEDGGEF